MNDSKEPQKVKRPRTLLTVFIAVAVMVPLFLAANYLMKKVRDPTSSIGSGLSDEQELAIDLVKKETTNKILVGPYAGQETTFEDRMKDEDPSGVYSWHAEERGPGVFLVGYVKDTGGGMVSGRFWEADTKKKVVKSVTGDRALELKYGLGSPVMESLFDVADVQYKLFEDIVQGGWLEDYKTENKGIRLTLEGTLINRTGEPIIDCGIAPKLTAQFKEDSVVEATDSYDREISPEVDENHPWLPGEERHFKASTDHLGLVYRDLKPLQAFAELFASAKGALGYNQGGLVVKIDVDWSKLQGIRIDKPGVIAADRFVNMRDAVLGKTLRKVKKGVTVNVLLERARWYQVELDGQIGWVPGTKVALVDTAAMASSGCAVDVANVIGSDVPVFVPFAGCQAGAEPLVQISKVEQVEALSNKYLVQNQQVSAALDRYFKKKLGDEFQELSALWLFKVGAKADPFLFALVNYNDLYAFPVGSGVRGLVETPIDQAGFYPRIETRVMAPLVGIAANDLNVVFCGDTASGTGIGGRGVFVYWYDGTKFKWVFDHEVDFWSLDFSHDPPDPNLGEDRNSVISFEPGSSEGAEAKKARIVVNSASQNMGKKRKTKSEYRWSGTEYELVSGQPSPEGPSPANENETIEPPSPSIPPEPSNAFTIPLREDAVPPPPPFPEPEPPPPPPPGVTNP